MNTALSYPTLPPTPAIALEAIRKIETIMLSEPNPAVPTEHTFHAGCYARTIRMAAGMVIVGALIKIPTLLIVAGSVDMLIGAEWTHLEGYHVIPASTGRKQIILSRSESAITMVFPTKVHTVDAAERAFTDEFDMLLSRRQGGSLCLE